MKIAVDLMGGDFAPLVNQEAAVKFLETNPNDQIIVFGTEEALNFPEFDQYSQIEKVLAPDIIQMDENMIKVFRKKKSSMFMAIDSVEKGNADVVVSAGGTGPLFGLSTMKIKTMPNVERAAIASPFPTINEKPTIILDLGGNADSQPEFLNDFATLGSEFAKIMFDKNNIQTGLLNIGKESNKGNELLKASSKLLESNSSINFVGNFEPNEVLENDIDVIVTDGYGGNILLKSTEGALKGFEKILRREMKENGIITKVGAGIASKAFTQIRKVFSSDNYGGAVILGLNSPVMKAKGSSKTPQILFTLNLAKKVVEAKMIEKLSVAMNDMQRKKEEENA
jgi:glycerol-3-phosphate acyltransferase PlsX